MNVLARLASVAIDKIHFSYKRTIYSTGSMTSVWHSEILRTGHNTGDLVVFK